MNTFQHVTRSAGFVAFLAVLSVASAHAIDRKPISSEKEREQLTVLRSDASRADKAIACKNLAIYGSSEAVPDLAKLLPDPQLSSWARIAIEAIPGQAADKALRTAAEDLEGRLLIGVINSIAVRRDTLAVDSLKLKLQDRDADVASAAAVALGHIGDAEATRSLRAAFSTVPAGVRSAVAEGCVLCAERLHAAGESVAARNIYDQVRAADVPMQRIIEATRGTILARGRNGIPLLLEILRSPDKKLFQLALGTVREFPGVEIDSILAFELVRSRPERAALMVQAMADRPDTVVLVAVLNAAVQGPEQVRLSAIDALQRVGDDSCFPALLKIAVEADTDLTRAAADTLAVLPGNSIDTLIVGRLKSAKGQSYPLLLELVGRRGIDSVPDLQDALNHSSHSVRWAALIALGETLPLSRLNILVRQVLDPAHDEDASVARQALKTASIRMPDRDACATELGKVLERSPSGIKITLIEIISDVGGTKALQILAAAAKNGEPPLQDAGSRLLGKWNSLDAAPVLLDLANTASQKRYRIRALRGYLGLVRKFSRGAERAEMCQVAIDAAVRSDEQELALEVLTLRPDVDGLRVAVKTQQLPGLKNAATKSTRVIAQKLREKGVDVTELISAAGLPEPE